LAEEPDMVLAGPDAPTTFTDENGATRWFPEAAKAFFYADCDSDTADWAAARLRGQSWLITQEQTPLLQWPAIPCSYILGVDDPVINPAWSRRAAPEVLGVTPIELPAGHSPFLSVPQQLADTLVMLASLPRL
jgi:hypothetical protein